MREKIFKKNISSEAIRRMNLKLCRNVHNISLYKNCFLLPLLMLFRCYGNLKFPLTYNEKSESRSLFLSHGRYSDRTIFYKCLLNSLPPGIKKLYNFLILICCHGSWKSKMLSFYSCSLRWALWPMGLWCWFCHEAAQLCQNFSGTDTCDEL